MTSERIALSHHLRDGLGRVASDLRISVTDRCNLRCTYCMPRDGLQLLPKSEVLTYEEIERLARIFVGLGVSEIRLTGGEPTVRPEFPKLVRMLSGLRAVGLESLALTTNGMTLEEIAGDLAAAGIDRINVSLDSLIRDRFCQITRRDSLDRVLAGLAEIEKYPTVRPIKVNCVAIRNFSEEEILGFARLARERPYVVRFIEFMPLDADGNWQPDLVLPGRELRAMIDAWQALEPIVDGDAHATSQRFRFADGRGEIGFINSVSEPFCRGCNRVRLTADGQLRTCLFAISETDLRGPLRAGSTDDEIAAIVVEAVRNKESGHRINDSAGFRRASRSMCQIGG